MTVKQMNRSNHSAATMPELKPKGGHSTKIRSIQTNSAKRKSPSTFRQRFLKSRQEARAQLASSATKVLSINCNYDAQSSTNTPRRSVASAEVQRRSPTDRDQALRHSAIQLKTSRRIEHAASKERAVKTTTKSSVRATKVEDQASTISACEIDDDNNSGQKFGPPQRRRVEENHVPRDHPPSATLTKNRDQNSGWVGNPQPTPAKCKVPRTHQVMNDDESDQFLASRAVTDIEEGSYEVLASTSKCCASIDMGLGSTLQTPDQNATRTTSFLRKGNGSHLFLAHRSLVGLMEAAYQVTPSTFKISTMCDLGLGSTLQTPEHTSKRVTLTAAAIDSDDDSGRTTAHRVVHGIKEDLHRVTASVSTNCTSSTMGSHGAKDADAADARPNEGASSLFDMTISFEDNQRTWGGTLSHSSADDNAYSGRSDCHRVAPHSRPSSVAPQLQLVLSSSLGSASKRNNNDDNSTMPTSVPLSTTISKPTESTHRYLRYQQQQQQQAELPFQFNSTRCVTPAFYFRDWDNPTP